MKAFTQPPRFIGPPVSPGFGPPRKIGPPVPAGFPPPGIKGLGDGFIADSNYWQQLAAHKVPFVFTPGHPSARLVAKTSLRGYLGDGSPQPTFTPADPNGNYINGEDGCVYNSYGLKITCPTAGAFPEILPPLPPTPPGSPGVWQQITDFLSSPLYAGSSIKTGYVIAGGVGLALLLGATNRRR